MLGNEGWSRARHAPVRILMPPPYAAEHDFFLRKHLKTGFCRILGNPTGRPVARLRCSGTPVVVTPTEAVDLGLWSSPCCDACVCCVD